MIRDTSYRFGEWEFRASVDEVWDGRREAVILLTGRQSFILKQLIAAWPEYVPKIERMALYRLREKVGSELIIIDRRGYRFNPEAVL